MQIFFLDPLLHEHSPLHVSVESVMVLNGEKTMYHYHRVAMVLYHSRKSLGLITQLI